AFDHRGLTYPSARAQGNLAIEMFPQDRGLVLSALGTAARVAALSRLEPMLPRGSPVADVAPRVVRGLLAGAGRQGRGFAHLDLRLDDERSASSKGSPVASRTASRPV